MFASIHQGRCEMTIVATLLEGEATGDMYTVNGNVGTAVLTFGEKTAKLDTAVLPEECNGVVTPGKVYSTTAALNPDLIGFRTVLADRAFFYRAPGQRRRRPASAGRRSW